MMIREVHMGWRVLRGVVVVVGGVVVVVVNPHHQTTLGRPITKPKICKILPLS